MNIESFMLTTTLRLLAAALTLMTLTVVAARAETQAVASDQPIAAGAPVPFTQKIDSNIPKTTCRTGDIECDRRAGNRTLIDLENAGRRANSGDGGERHGGT